MIAAIPQLKENSQWYFDVSNSESYKMYLFLICLLFLLKILTEILKLDERSWGILPVFYCLRGMPLNIRNSLKGRICYIFLIIISLYISQDLLDLATTDELDTTRISVENFEDLDNLNIPIYSPYSGIFDAIPNNISKNLKTKTTHIKYDQVWDCLNVITHLHNRKGIYTRCSFLFQDKAKKTEERASI